VAEIATSDKEEEKDIQTGVLKEEQKAKPYDAKKSVPSKLTGPPVKEEKIPVPMSDISQAAEKSIPGVSNNPPQQSYKEKGAPMGYEYMNPKTMPREERKIVIPPTISSPIPNATSPPPMGSQKPINAGGAPFQSILLRASANRSTSPMRSDKPNLSVFDMLEISKNNRPQPQDSLFVSPINPVPFKKSPEQFPTVPMLISPDLLSKFEDDTLFFMFYYQQGTYEQFLAVQELKRRGWIYHIKYMTWFRKYENPKTGKSDEKTYLYFDYESGWCQRIKPGFEFEEKFMENSM